MTRTHRFWDIECKLFSSLLSAKACAINLFMANRAFDMLENGISIFLIDEFDLDRLIYCSNCNLFPPEKAVLANQFILNALFKLVDTVEKWDEYRRDPEMMEIRRKARGKRYRDAHREIIRLNKKIHNLQKQLRLEDIWDDEEEDEYGP